jgi:hypothetical protein
MHWAISFRWPLSTKTVKVSGLKFFFASKAIAPKALRSFRFMVVVTQLNYAISTAAWILYLNYYLELIGLSSWSIGTYLGLSTLF